MMCNYIVSPIHRSLVSPHPHPVLQGNERWVEALEHDFHEEFAAAKPEPWFTIESDKIAGTVRTAGGNGNTAGNVTYVTVYEAGSVFSPMDHSSSRIPITCLSGIWYLSISRQPLW